MRELPRSIPTRSQQIRIEMKLFDIRNRAPNTRREGGQTIALMAVAMVSVLAMAALAIDLTTLYVAHGEIQRAADAAALAGAKAFVDSGVTTSPSNPNLQTLAQGMAVDYATAVAAQNNVAGAPAGFINGTPQVNLTISLSGNPSAAGNPNVTVTLQRTGLPLFFARIWGNSIASVSATAIAEAYNPAYSQTNTGGTIPPAPKCVKPFLVPNLDQAQGVPFVNTTTGAITAASLPFIGETITLTSACGATPGVCSPSGPPWTGKYLPMLLPDTHRYCPNCAGSGNFLRSTACCDGTVFDYLQCGVSGATGKWDQSPVSVVGGANGQAQLGLQCLIHNTVSTGPPGGNPPQDVLNVSQANNGLLQINPGTYSQSHYGVAQGSVISTSGSIITVPLFDPSTWSPVNPQVTIVGFLQLFVNYAGPTPTTAPNGDMNATILNVIGCGNSLGASSAISGGGASAIPVRLIHN
jgi:Putative Flp pilus-assembly TadE/G-like